MNRKLNRPDKSNAIEFKRYWVKQLMAGLSKENNSI